MISQISAQTKDTVGWTKLRIIEYSINYIEETKKEFAKRAADVEKEIGEKVQITYTYFDIMTADQKKIHDKFLKGRLSDKDTELHINAFLADLEKARVVLAEAELKAKEAWDKKNANKVEPEYTESESELYGTKIKSKRFGVILDNSYSMDGVLPKLRAEIQKKFPDAYFIEIYGSFFEEWDTRADSIQAYWRYTTPNKDENPFESHWFCPKIPESHPHYFVVGLEQNNIAAMTALSEFRKVDTIYWFSDMKDKVEPKAVAILSQILKKNNTKLYAHIIQKQPAKELKELIKETGGEIIRTKIK